MASPIAHDYGDPLQVWKWPALLFIGGWSLLAGPPGTAVGYALGTVVGAAIMFLVGTYIARKVGIAQRMPWWLLAGTATLAGAFSVVGVVSGSIGGAFIFVYLVLLALAWLVYGGAGLVGLRERTEPAEADARAAE